MRRVLWLTSEGCSCASSVESQQSVSHYTITAPHNIASYTYKIQYKPTGKHGNADTLSRLPVSNDQHLEQDYSLVSELNYIHSFQLEKLPLRATDVAKATRDDAILDQVQHFIQQG